MFTTSKSVQSEYEKITGAKYIDEFLGEKVLVYDKTIYDYFINLQEK